MTSDTQASTSQAEAIRPILCGSDTLTEK